MVRHHSDNDIVFNYPDSQRVSIVIRSAIAGPALAKELRETIAGSTRQCLSN